MNTTSSARGLRDLDTDRDSDTDFLQCCHGGASRLRTMQEISRYTSNVDIAHYTRPIEDAASLILSMKMQGENVIQESGSNITRPTRIDTTAANSHLQAHIVN